jgi:cytochrome c556
MLSLCFATSVFTQEVEDMFANTIEMRHGLMLQMASDLGTMGAMAKGDAAYDGAATSKVASNVAAIASVLSMAQFPAGSKMGSAADSSALPAIWTAQEDLLMKLADLNTAAGALQSAAGTDLEALKAGMAGVGKAYSACHKAYRQAE